jgi:hypothetical protein
MSVVHFKRDTTFALRGIVMGWITEFGDFDAFDGRV